MLSVVQYLKYKFELTLSTLSFSQIHPLKSIAIVWSFSSHNDFFSTAGASIIHKPFTPILSPIIPERYVHVDKLSK